MKTEGHPDHRGHFRHRRRVQEVLPGEIDISNASRPILRKEMDACLEAGIQYIELPVAFDALTVVINPKNTWAKTMTVAELKKIWEPAAQGKITKWNQVNPLGRTNPSNSTDPAPIRGPSITSRKPSWGNPSPAGETSPLPRTTTSWFRASPTTRAGWGISGWPTTWRTRTPCKPLRWTGGKAGVLPSMETVKNGSYAPLSRPIFIYVSKKSARRPEVQRFVDFYLETRPTLVSEVKYVPLPEAEYDGVSRNGFKNGQAGTAFGGKAEVGVSIMELLNRRPKL
jgi:phosphate transport system substrate-binding protein